MTLYELSPIRKMPLSKDRLQHLLEKDDFPQSKHILRRHLVIDKMERHQQEVVAINESQVRIHPCTNPNCAEAGKKPILLTTNMINSDPEVSQLYYWRPDMFT